MTQLPDPEVQNSEGDEGRPKPSKATLAIGVVLLVGIAVSAVLLLSRGGDDPDSTASGVQEIVVPRGTAEKIKAGETVDVMPSLIEVKVGEDLVLTNDDTYTHVIGPQMVKAGESVTLNFGAPGSYQGYCEINADREYKIVVVA